MTSSDAFAEKMAKMMQALDSVDISKDGGARLGGGGPLYFNQDDRAGEERKPDVGPEKEESKDEEVELYGDTMDDEDAEYVTEHLRGEIDANADAALACPCCFVTVCYAGQRHDKYETQYRAEKAVNCRVDKDRVLLYAKSKLVAKAQISSSNADGDDEEYFPVLCSDCNTTVGVKPVNGSMYIYFFHVIPSHI
ncbi:unnamed protein product [Aphanomyces euteiches]